MSRYAQNTSVSVEKSKSEIEKVLQKYGASKIMTMQEPDKATIAFQVQNRAVRFVLNLPNMAEERFWKTPARRNRRTQEQAYKEWEQECRSLWRALLLCIRAKIEAVEVGITTFEHEFLAHFVNKGGQTIGDIVIPQLDSAKLALPWG